MVFLQEISSIIGGYQFMLIAVSISFLLKLSILITLLRSKVDKTKPWGFILIVLISSVITDSAWIVKLVHAWFLPTFDYRIILLYIRISWCFYILQFHCLALFIESISEKSYAIPMRQKIFAIISSFFILFFFGQMIFNFNCFSPLEMFDIERNMQRATAFYLLFPLMISTLVIVTKKIRSITIPAILQKQYSLLMHFLIIPHWLSEFIHLFPFQQWKAGQVTQSMAFVSISTFFLTIAIFFCTRKILGLRFLNINNHVQRPMDIHFINDFRNILEQLSCVTNFRELGHITQSFLKDVFGVPSNKTRFYLRNVDDQTNKGRFSTVEDDVSVLVETFLVTHAHIIERAMKEEKALIYDEIDFSHFYDGCEKGTVLLHFLRSIDADIFLPIYEKDTLLAYIIVDRHARSEKFYSNVERDELIVLSSYLGNIINLLQNKNLEVIIEQEQKLRKELYHKHQAINQYKESIRSFLRKHQGKQIGVLFYKNRIFTYGNQAAKEFIDINLNKQEGHPLVHALKQLVGQVETFKGQQTIFVKDTHETTLVFSAVPPLEQNTIVITISYPDISDTIKHHLDLLKNPTEWDYLLYLQTTQSGKLINKLIPSSGPTLLNFKIELLKVALGQEAILLETPEQDLLPTVEMLHHISLREKLHVVAVQNQQSTLDIAISLFGINPIFGVNATNERPLLEQLDMVGTLFIKNIHLMDMETQEYLAEFIRYGYFRVLKSDHKIVSNVRIICSSNNLSELTHEGKFSKALFQELKATTLSMPSLLTLPEDELNALVEGFTQQNVASQDLQHIFSLNEKEKDWIMYNRPASLQELKMRIQQLLIKKSQKSQIYQETEFAPAEITDPDLIAIARLGKQALKDQKIMTMLWNKFKNQNKISLFLNVNRSSVNRRCKEYNLL